MTEKARPNESENRIILAPSFAEFVRLVRANKSEKAYALPGGRFVPTSEIQPDSGEIGAYGKYEYFVHLVCPTFRGVIDLDEVVHSKPGFEGYFKRFPQFDPARPDISALRAIKTAQIRLRHVRRLVRRVKAGGLVFKNYDPADSEKLIRAAQAPGIKSFL